MKQILLVLVGGTICTKINGNVKSIDKDAGIKIKENYLRSDSEFASDVRIDLTENLSILSENMTPEKWSTILSTYRDAVSAARYDGVIFAHGTDSLAYSAALFSLLLNRTEIPVFFVSSNENLDSPRANGNENFRAAVECICRGITQNVYVPYRNISDGQTYLHLASRLRQCDNYSEDFFSEGAINISDRSAAAFAGYRERLVRLCPKHDSPAAFADLSSVRLSDCVLYIRPYVGINYDAYRYENFKAVLHGTYHSGTACAEITKESPAYGKHSILHMIDLCAETGVDCYLTPSKLQGEPYDSVVYIGEHGKNGKKISFLYGTTNETAYVKLMLAYSNFTSPEEIQKFLCTEYNYEFVAR